MQTLFITNKVFITHFIIFVNVSLTSQKKSQIWKVGRWDFSVRHMYETATASPSVL